MEKINQNKALWIFPNIKESVDILPPNLRGKAWEMIINYGFGDENVEQNCKNMKVLLTFRVVKPLLRLRGIAGSQNGKSNNPSGLSKNKQPNIGAKITPNITPIPLITETETETENKTKNKEIYKEKNNRYGELKNVILTQEQYETLAGKYPNLDVAIEKLDTWLGTSGSKNKNKNHFAYFKSNSWVWENLPKGEVKTQNIKPNTLPVDIDLWNGEYYDFNLSKVVAKSGDNPDWSKYNRETGTFDL